ncbi:sulfate permease [Agromyces agglutinans]|uniref:sulfate permease n=1 Tax=Agromyces agglutinans TaxID=2662258 RepID=UPI001C12CEAE|nr:sulfate permease [Agromyces agglutinans]
MFAIVWALSLRTVMSVRRFLPTSILMDRLHTRRGLKWGVPAMLLAVPYAFAAMVCAAMGEQSGWFSVLALLFVWNAFKFLVAGPATLLQLLRVRARERRARRIQAMLELEAERGHVAGERAEPALRT